ncbi:hypothetical protein [Croceiramulus getboli]|nr:hypothetical protein P8624_02485 [Flavobacteriaceae bacterium YJPT1-3]
MKKLLILFSILIVLVACSAPENQSSELIAFIPDKTALFVKTNDLQGLQDKIKNHPFFQTLAATDLADYFSETAATASQFTGDDPALLTYTLLGKNDLDFTFISERELSRDSSFVATDTLNYNGTNIWIQDGNSPLYLTQLSKITLGSSSQLLIENAIRSFNSGQLNEDEHLAKIYRSASNSSPASLFIKGTAVAELWQLAFPHYQGKSMSNTFDWLLLDLEDTMDQAHLQGVLLTKKSDRLHLFEKNTPKTYSTATVTPSSATQMTAITYTSSEQLRQYIGVQQQADLKTFTLPQQDLLNAVDELGSIRLTSGELLALHATDIIEARSALKTIEEPMESFREVPLYRFPDSSAFAKAFSGLIELPVVRYHAYLNEHLLFADSEATLKTVIANVLNHTVWQQDPAFKEFTESMSDAASWTTIYRAEGLKGQLGNWVDDKQKKQIKQLNWEDYPYIGFQLIQDDQFMHLNVLARKNTAESQKGTVTQLASTTLQAPLSKTPLLVKNHRTKGMDVVVQDLNNTLYLISNRGKILWKKDLDGAILGNIHQVDLYKNGRLQLAFATPNTFYILDRNGEEVAPFPMRFSDAVTQPLAVFDYDGNRNYRFVIIQDKNVFMYDRDAKRVTGFTYDKAPDPVIQPARHLRIKNKDYILLALASGTLEILSRTGTTRVPVDAKIDFGEAVVFEDGTQFITYDVNGNLISINDKGGMSKVPSGLGSTAQVMEALPAAEPDFLVVLQDELLKIGTQEVTIPLGRYTAPRLFKVATQWYIALTNLDDNQVYVYDQNGKLLPGFPVYGSSGASVGFLQRNGNLGFTVQGESDTVLIYQIN